MRPSQLEGLITDEVGDALRSHARDVPADQAIVEIGSFKGKSTCYLAAGAREGNGAKVYAVDPWDLAGNPSGRFGFAERSTRRTFGAQLDAAGLWDQVEAIQGFSVDVAAEWSGPQIGLLYIDGDHSESAVKDDVGAWSPWLASGATVIFDDLDTPKNPGVRRAVEFFVRSHVLSDFKVEAGRLAVCRG